MIGRQFSAILAITVVVGVALGQEFEVASIRINKADNSGAVGQRISIQAAPGSLTMRNVTLMSSIRWAYNVHDYQIIGGPDWRNSERYDIVAKPAATASEEDLRLMLRALLSARFKLAVTSNSKEMPAYILTVDKNGHRLRPSPSGGERGIRPADRGLAFQNASMSDLQQFLSALPVIDRPVVDKTALEGRFDFTLTFFDGPLQGDPLSIKGAAANGSESVYADALARIGLRLEEKRVAIQTITISHAEKPSEN